MAKIEEVEPHNDRLHLLRVRVTRPFKSKSTGDFNCRLCDSVISPGENYKTHLSLCKRAHQASQENYRQNNKKANRAIKKFDLIYNEIKNGNFLYAHQNQSNASGIGEFASNCATFTGTQVVDMLERGLALHKKRSLYQFFESLFDVVNYSTTRALLRKPDAVFVSAMNDILLLSQYQSYDDHLHTGDHQERTHISNAYYVTTLRQLIWMFKVGLYQQNRTCLDPLIFQQMLAIRRSQQIEDIFQKIGFDNTIAKILLEDIISTTRIDLETDLHMLYNTPKIIFDLDKKVPEDDDIEDLYDDPTLFIKYLHKSDSSQCSRWQRSSRVALALQVFRMHMDRICLGFYPSINFGVMSYITPCIQTVESRQEEIRNGTQKMARKFLSIATKSLESDHGSKVELFGDIIEAISLFDALDCSSKAWDAAVSTWLIKNVPQSLFEENQFSSTQKYWIALQGFRVAYKTEKFRQKCGQAILENKLVLRRLGTWLDVPDLETYKLSWEDLDPDSKWSDGFWSIPIPPENIRVEYLLFCRHSKHWRIFDERSRLKLDLYKLYGNDSRKWAVYNFVENNHCGSCSEKHPPISDWRVYLQWEEREVLIKNMIRENLQRTWPDIMSGTIVTQAEDGHIEGYTALVASNDEVIYILQDPQSTMRSSDTFSDIYPSYDTAYIHR